MLCDEKAPIGQVLESRAAMDASAFEVYSTMSPAIAEQERTSTPTKLS
jgi:hypothetical protein